MQHYNPSIAEDMNRIFNLKSGDLNNEVSEEITPIIEVKPRINIIKRVNKATTGGTTIYTTPADKDFYMTSCLFGFIKDAANDMVTGEVTLNFYIDGVLTSFMSLPVLVSTAQSQSAALTFDPPIKIDRNTAISIGAQTYTAGLMSRSATITGYTQETYKGV